MTVQQHAATILRAAAQKADYTFRRMTARTSRGPISIVYVYGPNGTYQITEGPQHDRCSCKHYTQRLAGTLSPCKHIVLKRAWDERERRAAVPAAPQPGSREVRNDWGV